MHYKYDEITHEIKHQRDRFRAKNVRIEQLRQQNTFGNSKMIREIELDKEFIAGSIDALRRLQRGDLIYANDLRSDKSALV